MTLARRAVMAFLIACALLTALPTGWLIEPHRMFVARSADGRDLIHFERTVLFPLYLRSDSAFVADRTGVAWCAHGGFAWISPAEDGPFRARPWPPHCEAPPPAGDYHIFHAFRLCVWKLCARPLRFVSDLVRVGPHGRIATPEG